ncbi:hypothetical protein EVAR_61297_1 [Eumeta japonica]|uniref:Uncharacterized protein n=1 Tax=Eumeta variegata TaxID=151549 RepID=A0A4C1XMP5_EUMVA|nr:hypothetical protein EVAR_61297_1 [Eumeta japonica]
MRSHTQNREGLKTNQDWIGNETESGIRSGMEKINEDGNIGKVLRSLVSSERPRACAAGKTPADSRIAANLKCPHVVSVITSECVALPEAANGRVSVIRRAFAPKWSPSPASIGVDFQTYHRHTWILTSVH